MADATIKPDSGNDLVLSNDDGSAKIEVNENGTVAVTGTVSGVTASEVGLGNVTNESKATMFTSPTFTGNVAVGSNATGTFQGTVGSSATISTYTFPSSAIVQAQVGSLANGGGILNFTSSVAEQATGLQVNITPKFSDSKIYLMANLNAASIGQNCGVFWKMEKSGLTTRRSFDTQSTYGSTWKTGAMIGVSVGWTDDGTPISHSWQDTAQNNTTQHEYFLMANVADTSTGTYLSMNHRGNDANFGSVSYCLALEIKA